MIRGFPGVFYNKKGEEGDSIFSASFLIKALLIILVAMALYFMIRSVANAFIPK